MAAQDLSYFQIPGWLVPNVTRVTVILLAAAVSACASVGKSFDTQRVPSLALGKTSVTEYRAMFGEPFNVTQQSNIDGKFEQAQYAYAFADMGTAKSRVLTMEFRNGVLNAYNYISNFDEDKTNADLPRLGQLQMHKSTKAETLAALGTPKGKGLFPTQHPDFKDKAKAGATEI